MRKYSSIIFFITFFSFARNITNHCQLFFKINYCNNNYKFIIWLWDKYLLQYFFSVTPDYLDKNDIHIKPYKRNMISYSNFICLKIFNYEKARVNKLQNGLYDLSLLIMI